MLEPALGLHNSHFLDEEKYSKYAMAPCEEAMGQES